MPTTPGQVVAVPVLAIEHSGVQSFAKLLLSEVPGSRRGVEGVGRWCAGVCAIVCWFIHQAKIPLPRSAGATYSARSDWRAIAAQRL